jgi:hypothetical protein
MAAKSQTTGTTSCSIPRLSYSSATATTTSKKWTDVSLTSPTTPTKFRWTSAHSKERGQFKDGQYKILGDSKLKELKCIHDWILDELNRVENPDNPTAFYMNPLSDFNCRLIEVDGLINTMINVQPKESGGAASASPEAVVDGLVTT